jgi:hypothetical protein
MRPYRIATMLLVGAVCFAYRAARRVLAVLAYLKS